MLRTTDISHAADTIGLKALTFVASQPDMLERFLASTGADANALREHAGHRDTLQGVLDYLLTNEQLLLAFCADKQLEPAAVHRAAAQLGG